MHILRGTICISQRLFQRGNQTVNCKLPPSNRRFPVQTVFCRCGGVLKFIFLNSNHWVGLLGFQPSGKLQLFCRTHDPCKSNWLKPFGLKTPGSSLCLCGARVLCDLVSFCISVRRHNMPRSKGWSAAPLEWVHIVRARRPKSEQWPLAPGHSQYRTAQVSQQRQSGSGAKRGVERPGVRSVQPERKTRRSRPDPRHPPECHGCRQHQVLSGMETRQRNVHWRLRWPRHRNRPKKCPWHVRSRSQRSSSRGPGSGCLLQTRKFGWLKLLCRMPWTKRSSICAKSPWPKHVSSASRRRLSRLVRHLPHPLCPIWKPPNWPRCRLHSCQQTC